MKPCRGKIAAQRQESGQTLVEYILLVAVLVTAVVAALQALRGQKIDEQIAKVLQESYRRAYQYGDPQTQGPDENGGPDRHPRIVGGNNFRIFINPGVRQ